MQKWMLISLLLCVFGFFRELRPSEPYITEFLLGEWRNLTSDEVNREVYPVGTYSHLAQLVIVFLITDFLRYKPLIITIGITGIIIWSMLLWTSSLQALQIVEFFYGTYMAAEVAYYTYIYAKVNKEFYPKVSSHTRAAMFLGKLVAGVLAQTLLYFELMNYRELNYITLGTQIIATIWAFGLPKVKQSLYFHRSNYNDKALERKASNVSASSKSQINDNQQQTAGGPFQLLWCHFRNAYTNPNVLQWSIWYSVGFCGYLQVTYYVQFMWKEIEPNIELSWNGAVDAILTALAAVSALAAGYIHSERLKPRSSLLLLALLSALEAAAIIMCCRTHNVFVSYVGFIIFGALYAFTITIASSEVARHLEEDSYGLVFGINTMLALILQTLLTLVVVSEAGFSLSIVGQFTTYAGYFFTVAILYLGYFLLTKYCCRSLGSSQTILD